MPYITHVQKINDEQLTPVQIEEDGIIIDIGSHIFSLRPWGCLRVILQGQKIVTFEISDILNSVNFLDCGSHLEVLVGQLGE